MITQAPFPSINQLCEAFRKEIRTELSLGQRHEVDRKNRAHDRRDTCATHDYCDANLCMLEAAKSLGLDLFPEGEERDESENARVWDLVNQAWNLAVKRGFAK